MYKNKKYADAFDAHMKHINEEINVWEEVDFSQPGMDLTHLADKLKEDIETNLKRRLIQATIRLRAKVDVSCSTYEGIDAVKAGARRSFKLPQLLQIFPVFVGPVVVS